MARIIRGRSRIVDVAVHHAKREAHRIREDAHRAGWQAGRDEGLATVTALLLRARADVARREAQAEADLRRLAVAIAGKLLGRELVLHPAAIADVVATALAERRVRGRLVLRVHPGAVASLTAARARLEAAAGTAALEIVADEKVAPGGCVVESDVGLLDARLETQLAALEDALTAR